MKAVRFMFSLWVVSVMLVGAGIGFVVCPLWFGIMMANDVVDELLDGAVRRRRARKSPEDREP